MPLTDPAQPSASEQFDIDDLAALNRFAGRLALLLPQTALVTLEGDLGAGKTTLVKALAEAVGIDPALVTSPTFSLIQVYEHDDDSLRLVHADMYRLTAVEELLELGWDDAIAAIPGGRCWAFVEWPSRIAPALPAERLELSLAITGETCRQLTLTGTGPEYATIPPAVRTIS